MRPLRIALLGSRGIPAAYGGYETFMEELSVRLVERGHRGTVYCRSHFTPPEMTEYRGVELVVLPTVASKYLDTPVHTLLSCLTAAPRDYDVALVVNSVNVLFVPLLQVGEIPTALHVDGIEKRRAKWGAPGRAAYALAERLAARVPDVLVTDAEVIRRHYLERYDAESTAIAYGVDPEPLPAGPTLDRLGLDSRRYHLYVSRFEPENNPHRVAAAYRDVEGDLPLVMVGGAPYANRFIESFTRDADPRILFPGPIYGEGYRELLSHAATYIHATEVGGTHPALVEAMGYGNCIVVNDAPENREVAGDDALYFEAHDLASLPRALAAAAVPERATALRAAAAARAADRYNWDRVCSQYETMFHRMVGR